MGRVSRVRRRGGSTRRSVAVAVLVAGSAVVTDVRAGTPDETVVVEVASIRVGADGPFNGDAMSPQISARGDRVAFNVDLDPGTPGTTAAFVRDRPASSTTFIPPAADAFALSGDGCV